MRSIRLHVTIQGQPSSNVFTTLASVGRDSIAGLFEGSWSCVDDGDDTAVTFAALLDVGIPHPAVETAAIRAVIDDAVVFLAGLFAGNVRVDDIVIQSHQPLAYSRA